jgi:hypothetical protein
MRQSWVIAKKLFSLSLIFNALLTICFATSVLANLYGYAHSLQPFAPYLITGNLFWVAIVAAVINIFPSAALGRSLHTGRVLFHHYFYGFIVLLCAVGYVVLFLPVSLFNLFFVFDTSIAVNVGKFFILCGITLVLDDLPDVSKPIESALNHLKLTVGKRGRLVSMIHFFCGAVSLYIFAAVALAMYYNPQWVTLANSLCAGTLFITAVTSFIFVRRQVWQKIKP